MFDSELSVLARVDLSACTPLEPAATTVRAHRAEVVVPTGEPLAGCAGRGAR